MNPHMTWHYSTRGLHVHVHVFVDGGKCGDLCFRIPEFDAIQQGGLGDTEFVEETAKVAYGIAGKPQEP